MNWIDCRVRLPEIDDNILIYKDYETDAILHETSTWMIEYAQPNSYTFL